jgi:ABC-type dipeptide/oligopeptide/nickel transport system permease subunit
MTAPLLIVLDIIPVLAMVFVILCIPLLGDGARQQGKRGN